MSLCNYREFYKGIHTGGIKGFGDVKKLTMMTMMTCREVTLETKLDSTLLGCCCTVLPFCCSCLFVVYTIKCGGKGLFSFEGRLTHTVRHFCDSRCISMWMRVFTRNTQSTLILLSKWRNVSQWSIIDFVFCLCVY